MGKAAQADKRTWAKGEAHGSVVHLGDGTDLSRAKVRGEEGVGKGSPGLGSCGAALVSVGAVGGRGAIRGALWSDVLGAV